jgi:antibiotic biosynthesis monooxygenase (ABM) superfamily enzyme
MLRTSDHHISLTTRATVDDDAAGDEAGERPPAVSLAVEEQQQISSAQPQTQKATKTASIVARAKLADPKTAPEYMQIVKEMADFCHENYPGHIYSRILENAKDGFISAVHRFDSIENLQIWVATEERAEFVKRLGHYVIPGSFEIEFVEGATQWLDVSDLESVEEKKHVNQKPPLWKTVILYIAAIYPQVLLLSVTLSPYLISEGYSTFVRSLINFAIILPISSYFVLPLLYRIFKFWLKMPRPQYPRHCFMYILDSGFTIFKPSNPDELNQVEEGILKRLGVTEQVIVSLQERMHVLEHGPSNDPVIELPPRDQLEKFITPKILMSANNSSSVSIKVTTKVPASFSFLYENYLEDLGSSASKFDGFLGFDVIRPSKIDAQGNKTYAVISRFSQQSHILVWLSSKERKDLIKRVSPFITVLSGDLEETVESFSSHGFDSLFVDESSNNPNRHYTPLPKYKTLILVYLIIIVNVTFIYAVVTPLYSSYLPSALTILINMTIDLILTTYFSSPLLNKLFQDWIHSQTEKDIPTSSIGKCLYLGIPGLR